MRIVFLTCLQAALISILFFNETGLCNNLPASGSDSGNAIRFADTKHAILDATFFGGSGIDGGFCLALDGKGSIYVGGYTSSTDLPTTSGAFQENHGGGAFDYYIAKFDESLTTLEAATYLGGNNVDGQWGFNLALDADGNVFVAGCTNSLNFPTTPGAFDTLYNGGTMDAFVSKLDADLENLLASTYVGGSGMDGGDSTCLALNADGSVYISGHVKSANFPTTSGAYDTTYNGAYGDGFITRLSNDLTTLEASTFFGGNGTDFLSGIAIDAAGSVIATGTTSSNNFPVTPGAYDVIKGLMSDGFVSKLSADLTTLQASTFFGNDGGECCSFMILDPWGNVFFSGQTDTDGLPVTPGAYDPTHNGDWDNYVAKLNNSLDTLLGCTYLGGSAGEFGHAIECDAKGCLYLSGGTMSPDHPCTPGAHCATYHPGAHDLFLTRFTPDLTALSGSTFFGATGGEVGYRLLLNPFGELYVTGPTESTDFPVTGNAYDTSYNGGGDDAYIARFVLNGMYADSETLSEQGGSIEMNLVTGTENASRLYLVLGSLSGAIPGLPLPGGQATLPINWDVFTDVVLAWVNTPVFGNFMSTLDAHGNNAAQIATGPIPSGFTGSTLHFAACMNAPFDTVTNPVEITIVP